jgi:hypothetical protein
VEHNRHLGENELAMFWLKLADQVGLVTTIALIKLLREHGFGQVAVKRLLAQAMTMLPPAILLGLRPDMCKTPAGAEDP